MPDDRTPPVESPEHFIAVAVVECGDGVLVGRRPEGVALAGLWEFPGGKIEPGERPAAAARRECLEETGLDVELDRCVAVVRHWYDHGPVVIHFFHGRLTDAAAQPVRPPFLWKTRSELPALDFPAANAPVIALLASASRWAGGDR